MRLFLLNTLIIPFQDDEACFKVTRVDAKKASDIIKENNNVISAVGHDVTAKLMSNLLGYDVKTNRLEVFFEEGDQAIAFTLRKRLKEGEVLTTVQELERIGYQLFWIVRNPCK
ncbi:STIV orfB116 family protein [Sulfuracidifex metallicus]|uniref:DUF1874 domain-containing protein n=1 Tax=Sulfuracidifex metallicus DSM 6482 = JCM 9184 TaxID=523847 RepID=A0A6A9QVF6_SULME|nr:DUF1874 domain-containing protein [Sulfuracidifex metallicus]MUN29753.1 DUF1874 domain-containing protein [Sulfuracidifex metallicus DSM 6482 = JCM 9184]WOE51866.1 DUF1874 domain-containing protein [Sulfuracidifex metallicus DSM 6482 = JCM 9184]